MPATRLGEDVDRVRSDTDRLGRDLKSDLPQLARRATDHARGLLEEGVDRLRGQGREAADAAGENLETARVFVVERVQERPLTATVAALGVGFLLGALLAGSRR